MTLTKVNFSSNFLLQYLLSILWYMIVIYFGLLVLVLPFFYFCGCTNNSFIVLSVCFFFVCVWCLYIVSISNKFHRILLRNVGVVEMSTVYGEITGFPVRSFRLMSTSVRRFFKQSSLNAMSSETRHIRMYSHFMTHERPYDELWHLWDLSYK